MVSIHRVLRTDHSDGKLFRSWYRHACVYLFILWTWSFSSVSSAQNFEWGEVPDANAYGVLVNKQFQESTNGDGSHQLDSVGINWQNLAPTGSINRVIFRAEPDPGTGSPVVSVWQPLPVAAAAGNTVRWQGNQITAQEVHTVGWNTSGMTWSAGDKIKISIIYFLNDGSQVVTVVYLNYSPGSSDPPRDTDGDGIPDDEDDDDDGDGIPDDEDPDDDGDGIPDEDDPDNDDDGDGIPNPDDDDDDGDGIPDTDDPDHPDHPDYPGPGGDDPTEPDNDGDGIPDDEDPDDDNDGIPDIDDPDADGDGVPDDEEEEEDPVPNCCDETIENLEHIGDALWRFDGNGYHDVPWLQIISADVRDGLYDPVTGDIFLDSILGATELGLIDNDGAQPEAYLRQLRSGLYDVHGSAYLESILEEFSVPDGQDLLTEMDSDNDGYVDYLDPWPNDDRLPGGEPGSTGYQPPNVELVPGVDVEFDEWEYDEWSGSEKYPRLEYPVSFPGIGQQTVYMDLSPNPGNPMLVAIHEHRVFFRGVLTFAMTALFFVFLVRRLNGG